ncbi:FMN-binding negative transcriptional regulator [Propionibacterium australiense]|uniref:FMN-binding domain n=1 Tax=Propionibacterium australiense TaxID=119981 RepID=A0A383S2H8_9ACTN|nr:FMN-binding negative transcriptional regulator [Propionibacterium australiense]RLP11519.1 FMN-binding negative transcriptional regulator [Propionibacterium australiense]RLP12747.1 FMN-binding negative transcriptional regulator [Propionibacterium australiense]SYZ32228.1 Putative FMN-binding domain [Propionibacterium australiense]VEH90631.1 Protease synthase and sporulation protein PAI 2 [Propionibacterium australiense]
MYVPEHFTYDAGRLGALLHRVGAGDLVTNGPDGLEATFLPWSLDPTAGEHGVLRSHMARVNPQWHDQGPALVILHGPDDYIDPSDHEAPGQVPTWNYITMHVRGTLLAHEDPEWIIGSLGELVAAQPTGWTMAELSPERLSGMVAAIVGVELRITSITGKAKMSQNRPSSDIDALADALEARRTQDEEPRYPRPSMQAVEYLRGPSREHALAREQAVERARTAKKSGKKPGRTIG